MLPILLNLIESPTGDPLALFLVQVLLIITLVRILGRLLVKIRQPMVIGEICAGILLGPSALGQIPNFSSTVFPPASLPNLKLFADVGLIFFMFFLGLEVDIKQMQKSLKQSIPIAVCSIIIPFAAGAVLSMWFYNLEDTQASFTTFLLFFGTALSFTAFPVLARVLTSAKLLSSPVGSQALGCAAVDDLLAWCTLALTLSYASGGGVLNGLYVALISLGLVLFLTLIIRPALEIYHQYLIRHNDELNRNFLALLFLLLCLTAWFSQILGIEAFVGSFIFGICVPKGGTLIDNLAPKIELLIVEFFLPLYFANSGIRTNIGGLDKGEYWGGFFAVVAVGSAAKILPVTLLARLTVRLNKYGELFSMNEAATEIAGGEDLVPALHKVEQLDKGTRMPWRQCFTLGILMNTRGLVGLIVLNIGLSANILGTKVFTIMVLFSLVTTFLTPPSLFVLYQRPYHQSIEKRIEELKEAERLELERASAEAQASSDSGEGMQLHPALAMAVSNSPHAVKLHTSFGAFDTIHESPISDDPSHALINGDTHPALAMAAEGRMDTVAGSSATVQMLVEQVSADTRLQHHNSNDGVSSDDEAAILATQLAAFGSNDRAAIEIAQRRNSENHHGISTRTSSERMINQTSTRQLQIDPNASPAPPSAPRSALQTLLSSLVPASINEEERSISTREALKNAYSRGSVLGGLASPLSVGSSRNLSSYRPRSATLAPGYDSNGPQGISQTGPSGFGKAARAREAREAREARMRNTSNAGDIAMTSMGLQQRRFSHDHVVDMPPGSGSGDSVTPPTHYPPLIHAMSMGPLHVNKNEYQHQQDAERHPTSGGGSTHHSPALSSTSASAGNGPSSLVYAMHGGSGVPSVSPIAETYSASSSPTNATNVASPPNNAHGRHSPHSTVDGPNFHD